VGLQVRQFLDRQSLGVDVSVIESARRRALTDLQDRQAFQVELRAEIRDPLWMLARQWQFDS